MARTRGAVAAVAAVTLALIASAPPATAERDRDRDARKDVVALSDTGPGYRAAPDNKNTDVTRVVMRHSPNRVIVRTHLRDLNRRTGFAVYQIRTDDHRFEAVQILGAGTFLLGPEVVRAMGISPALARAVRVAARDGGGAEGRFILADRRGEVVCDDLWYYSHIRKDRARMSIARSCLGNPEWVRLGAGVVSFDFATESIAADDALRRGIRDQLAMSPRLQRR